MAHLTSGQIRELIEIDTAGPGIRDEIQALIARFASGDVGVKTDDPREAQAKQLFDEGFGRELGLDSFDAYLATVPEIPEALKVLDERFHELVLVDARVGITRTCELLGVDYPVKDQVLEEEILKDFGSADARTEKIYWIRVQNGREQLVKDEIAFTVQDGLALLVQNPKVLRNRTMAVSGSTDREGRVHIGYLQWHRGRLRLFWYGRFFREPALQLTLQPGVILYT